MSEALALKLANIKKSFKTRSNVVTALKDVNMEVKPGEIYGFAGPNGAGKSTTIKILTGLLRPDSGQAHVFGHPAGSRQAKQSIGFLPEVTLYHEFMTPLELLSVHAALAGVPKKEVSARSEQALQKVGLWERRASRLKEYSKGMKQRFGIAQAIVGAPKLLILDELTSGLDPGAQTDLLNLLQDLREQGMTIFFSSHHLREIERICDSVAILHEGVLQQAGTLDQVLGDESRVFLRVRMSASTPPETEGVVWERESDTFYTSSIKSEQTLPTLERLKPQLAEVHTVETRRQTLEELYADVTKKRDIEEVAN